MAIGLHAVLVRSVLAKVIKLYIPMLTTSFPMMIIFRFSHSSLVILLIYMDELIEVLFICGLTGLPRIWLVTVAPAETSYPPPNCACTLCLVSVNVQVSGNISLCKFFPMEEFNTHFMSDVILPGCSLYQVKKYYGLLLRRCIFYCYTTNICLCHWEPTL